MASDINRIVGGYSVEIRGRGGGYERKESLLFSYLQRLASLPLRLSYDSK